MPIVKIYNTDCKLCDIVRHVFDREFAYCYIDFINKNNNVIVDCLV